MCIRKQEARISIIFNDMDSDRVQRKGQRQGQQGCLLLPAGDFTTNMH